jgi:hypothetical protein
MINSPHTFAKHTIDIAETAGLAFLGVMQTASPVDSDVALAAVQSCSAFHAASSADSAELEQAVEDGTVVANIVFALLFAEVVHVVWGDALQEIDVFVGVELGHFVLGCRLRAVDLQVLVETVVHDEGVCHADAVRLHWVACVIGVIANVTVVEVCDLLGLRGRCVDASARRIQWCERVDHGRGILLWVWCFVRLIQCRVA